MIGSIVGPGALRSSTTICPICYIDSSLTRICNILAHIFVILTHHLMNLNVQRTSHHCQVIAKLLLERRRVLDIGCGWGDLALELARNEHVEALGVTLSREQLSIAQNRARSA